MENIANLFTMHSYTVIKSFNSTWDERSYSFFYHLFRIAYENGTTESGSVHYKEDLLSFLVEGLGITIVTFFGIIGNVLSGIVLAKKGMRSSINQLLLGLSIADTVFIFCGLFALGIPNICAYLNIDFTQSAVVMIVPITYPIGISAHTASVYFTVVVTIERYLAVCHPFTAKKLCTYKRAVLIALAVTFFSILYNIPRWFEYTYAAILDEDGETVIRYMPLTTSFRRHPIYEHYYNYLGFFIFIYLTPVIALTVLNILIFRKVKAANAHRQTLSISENRETSLAYLLVIIVTVFLGCNSFTLITIITRVIGGDDVKLVQIDSLRNFFIVLNSCVNFIIYCVYGDRFRAMVVEMLPGSLRKVIEERKSRSQPARGHIYSISDSSERKQRSSSLTSNVTKSSDLPLTSQYLKEIEDCV